MNKKILFQEWFVVFIGIIALTSIIPAITFLSSDNIFDAKISYLNDEKLPYSVIVEVENKINASIDYDIEVFYKKKNVLVAKDSVECSNKCEVKLDLKRIFFGNYKIEVKAKYDSKHYKKDLKFEIEEQEEIKNEVYLQKIYYYNLSSQLNITGKLSLQEPSKVIIETYPIDNEELKVKHYLDCEQKVCDFTINLTSSILEGKYKAQIYIPSGTLEDEFFVSFKSKETQSNRSKSISSQNITGIESQKVNITKEISEVNVSDVFGNVHKVKVQNGSVEIPKSYSEVGLGDKRSNESVEVKAQIKSVETLEEVGDLDTYSVSETFGFTKMDNNLNDSFNSSFEIQSLEEDFNPVVNISEKVYYNSMKSYIDLEDNRSADEVFGESTKKAVPGVYKKEEIIRFQDGSTQVRENYFAYGLISINTKKPLYHDDEVVEFLIVVLDEYGFLVSDANITLDIITPQNDTIIYTSQDYDIYETSKKGVYYASYHAKDIGKYKLYAQVEQENMIVDVSSFFNVVKEYDFDIIRDVPATIDPWDGPFRSEFEITPLNGYKKTYNFTEIFSSDFVIKDTDADRIIRNNSTVSLVWYNKTGVSSAYYIAQTPLVSPYLYFLGKSYIDYDNEKRFYENRSWLFAIDPAARVCDYNSPCACAICGSGDGGDEPGAGTIDTCSDGNTNWEFVNNVVATDLNGSYFGVGDTVEICVEFVCETNEDITIGYKDETNAWDDTDIVWNQNGCDANYVTETHCTNVVLSNHVGAHHFRGKIVYNGNSNLICQASTYRDHDDIEIQVLDKVAPNASSWSLDNGTSTGNNLNVIRGRKINISVDWDLPLQDSRIMHNSSGLFVYYDSDSYENNQTNYTYDTSNLILFPSRGVIRTSPVTAWDMYFNISGNTTGNRDFFILAQAKVLQSKLEPSVGYQGINATMYCQVGDNNVNDVYNNVNITFYKGSTLLGSNMTNSTGWGQYTFTEGALGRYNITCNVSTDYSNYILTSSLATATRELIVRTNGSDVIIPVITNVSSVPSVFSIGGVTLISANVTDENLVDSVRVFVRKPDLTVVDFPMINTVGDMYSYTFTDTPIDGTYEYYIYALDNISNPAYSSTKSFEVVGVRTFVGIQSIQKIFKLGQSLNLTGYTKSQDVDASVYSEVGDVRYIIYTFDSGDEGWIHSGAQDEWERGVPTDSDLNTCDNGNCWCTDRNANYNNNANNNIVSPVIDMTGRTDSKISFWKEIRLASGVDDKVYFETYDGGSWNIRYQNTNGAHDQEPITHEYFAPEIDGISNAQLRFRMTSNGGTTSEGFTFDTVNVSFTPKQDWVKSWNYVNSTFGSDVDKVTAIKIGFNITAYSSVGSDADGTSSPDIEMQIYNGSAYTGSSTCDLDSSKSYPYYCEFVIKNTPQYLNPWKNSTLRNIRFRAIGIDGDDSISWTDVKREYITPSILENNGIGSMTAYLLEQFKNSTGGVVATLNFAPISIAPGESRNLSDFWTYSISGNFQLGNYTAYVALTDASGNVLQNEDDGSYINDSYEFTIQSLIINPILPRWNTIMNESYVANISLDDSFYGFGGWCGYSLNGAPNQTMNIRNSTSLFFPIYNQSDGMYNITFYCNDTDNYMTNTGKINFNVSQSPRIIYSASTDPNNSAVNRTWTIVNATIQDSSLNFSWIEFNGTNYTASCNPISGIGSYCQNNVSNLKNGLYTYRICANDTWSNLNCTEYRNVTINQTLPIITIDYPFDNDKYSSSELIYSNVSTQLPAYDIWCEFKSNSTTYKLSSVTALTWTNNFRFKTGYYNITCYGNDSIGNILVPKTNKFTVIADKDIKINKTISSISDKTYLINISIENRGNWTNYTIYDFVADNFIPYSYSVIPNQNTQITGIYTGNQTSWNISLPYLSKINIFYYLNYTNMNQPACLELNYAIAID